MITFILLLGLFGVAAPEYSGTVMASLGIITGVLGFDQAGVAMMLSIFALQDSFAQRVMLQRWSYSFNGVR